MCFLAVVVCFAHLVRLAPDMMWFRTYLSTGLTMMGGGWQILAYVKLSATPLLHREQIELFHAKITNIM